MRHPGLSGLLGLVVAGALAAVGLGVGVVAPTAAAALVLGVAAVFGAEEQASGAVVGLVLGVLLATATLAVRAALLPATGGWLAVGLGAAVVAAALLGAAARALPAWAPLAGVGALLALPGTLGAAAPDGEVVLTALVALGWGAAAGGVGVATSLALARVSWGTEAEPTHSAEDDEPTHSAEDDEPTHSAEEDEPVRPSEEPSDRSPFPRS